MKYLLIIIFILTKLIFVIPHMQIKWYEYNQKNTDVINYKNLKYNTGDIILFKHTDISFFRDTTHPYTIIDHYTNIGRFIIDGNEFSHIGIIIIKDGSPFIYDLADNYKYKKELKCHYKNKIMKDKFSRVSYPVLHPLKDIKKYSGDVFILPCKVKGITDKTVMSMLSKFETSHHSVLIYPECVMRNKSNIPRHTSSSFIVAILNHFNFTNAKKYKCALPINIYDFCIKSKLYSDNLIKIQKFVR